MVHLGFIGAHWDSMGLLVHWGSLWFIGGLVGVIMVHCVLLWYIVVNWGFIGGDCGECFIVVEWGSLGAYSGSL